MFCQKCGTKLPDDSKFCQKCGAKLATESAIQKPQEVAETSSYHPAEPISENVPVSHDQNQEYVDTSKKDTKKKFLELALITTAIVAIVVITVIIIVHWRG